MTHSADRASTPDHSVARSHDPVCTGHEPFLHSILIEWRFAAERHAVQELLVSFRVQRIAPEDVALMEALSATFGEAFEDVETYTRKRPAAGYLRQLLESDYFIALAALKNDEVVGGLAAYELKKFEQERSEIYIYDLAVGAAHRREGIATALIEELGRIAAARGAYVIFVQADTGVEDGPAIALYSRLGKREDVLHFDIAVERSDGGK